MRWQRRRRHSAGPFYLDTSRFWPTSWGIHEGPVTYNATRLVRVGDLMMARAGHPTYGKSKLS